MSGKCLECGQEYIGEPPTGWEPCTRVSLNQQGFTQEEKGHICMECSTKPYPERKSVITEDEEGLVDAECDACGKCEEVPGYDGRCPKEGAE